MLPALLSPPATLADADLARVAAAGDPAAERALFDRHVDRVQRLAARFAGDADLAADLTQEVFVRVFRGLGSFRGEAAFTTWLHRVTVTTCLNAMRRIARRRAAERPLVPFLHDALPAPDTPAAQEALADAIAELPPEHRLPLVMHALEGFSHQEIADALGLTEGTSKRRVHEAKERLRALLIAPTRGEDR